MIVKELIKILQDMPQDAEVITEGCDCYGHVGQVEVEKDKKMVFLYRPSGGH